MVVSAGSVLRVRWAETIDHPGHFRISFDASGEDAFVDPASATDTYTNEAVLLDDIADKNGGKYEVEVTLPNIECDQCTLQLVQLMTDKAPYQPGSNDLYYQCADLTLVRGPSNGGIDAGSGTGDAGNAGPAADAGTIAPDADAGPDGADDAGGSTAAVDGSSSGGEVDLADDERPAPPSSYGSCDVHATARDAFHLWVFAALALMLRRMRSP
jgi:hypothetical protein